MAIKLFSKFNKVKKTSNENSKTNVVQLRNLSYQKSYHEIIENIFDEIMKIYTIAETIISYIEKLEGVQRVDTLNAFRDLLNQISNSSPILIDKYIPLLKVTEIKKAFEIEKKVKSVILDIEKSISAVERDIRKAI